MPELLTAGRLPDGVSPTFARSAAFWLRAYPRRWRAARGDEVLGVLADLAAPGARRLDARSVLDLVRGGWETRLRGRPPLGPWLLYRVFARSLRNHLGWVGDDIAGAFFPLRYNLFPLVALVVIDATRVWAGGTSFFTHWVVWAAFVLSFAWEGLAGSTRRRAKESQLLPRPGERVTPDMWIRVGAPRLRIAARSALPWAAGSLVVLLGLSVMATVVAPSVITFGALPRGSGFGFETFEASAVQATPVALLAIALAVGAGALLAVAARRRLEACRFPEQPHRVVVRMAWRRWVRVLLGVGVLGAIPVAEAVGAWALSLSVPLGMAAGVLAPSAVVVWSAVRRSPSRDLAWPDVRRIALYGRPPVVDAPVSALAPADVSEVGAVRPWPWSNEGPSPAPG